MRSAWSLALGHAPNVQNGPVQVAAVVLAAGESKRFGAPKQLARFGVGTMLEAVVARAREAGLDPVIVVLPPGVASPPDTVPIVNARAAEGLSRSLRLGIEAVPAEADAAVILLGDQPTVPAHVIALIVDAARADRPLVAAVNTTGELAPPVLLMRDAFGLVADATGDEGLRSILRERREALTTVEVGEHPPDVDTPADLAQLRRR